MSKKNDKKEKIEEFFKICKKDSKFFEMDDFLVWKTIIKNVCTDIKKKQCWLVMSWWFVQMLVAQLFSRILIYIYKQLDVLSKKTVVSKMFI